MTHKPYQWNVVCDVCGREYKSGEIRKRWDGLLVCSLDYEMDHPQKYIRVRSDPVPVPADMIRPEPEDQFINVCTRYTQQGIAGIGVVGCTTAGQNNNLPFHSYGTPG